MRNAQNGVLAVVGVVEAKESAEIEASERRISKQEARRKLLRDEQARGELLDLLTFFLRVGLTWWPGTLVQRVQIGLYPRALSFVDILSTESGALRDLGVVGGAALIFAGAPATVLCSSLSLLLRWALEQCIGRMQTWLNGRLSERTFEQVNLALVVAAELGFLSIDVLLLPIQFHATVQRLGLPSPRPLLPSWSIVKPWSPYSMYSFIWNSAIDTPWVGKLCSPAVLLLFQNWLGQDGTLRMLCKGPIYNDVPIDEPESNITQRDTDQDWIDGLLQGLNLIHLRIMRWFGWKLQYIEAYPPGLHRYENDHIPDEIDSNASAESEGASRHLYRSTALSHLPAQYLSERIYDTSEGLIMLPFNSLVSRAVAEAYTTSTIFNSPETLAPTLSVYSPFGGGPFSALPAHGFTARAWNEVALYMSRLSLSLVLNSCIEGLVFFTAYGLARWQGVRNFAWGSSEIIESEEG